MYKAMQTTNIPLGNIGAFDFMPCPWNGAFDLNLYVRKTICYRVHAGIP
jgi:hypothetical protein